MRRRDFIALLGGTAAAWPLAAHAQQPVRIARIGLVVPDRTNLAVAQIYGALLAGLRELGFSEGGNLDVQFQVGAQESQGPAELIWSKVDLLVAIGPELSLKAALDLGRMLPIVMVAINYDPIARGYVSSLAQPGGNITGLFYRQPELAGKQVELLTQAFPARTRLAALWDAISADQFIAAEHMAQLLHLEIRGVKLESPPYDFDAAFRSLVQSAPEMLLVLSSPYFTPHRFRIAQLAIEHRLPAMFTFRHYVEAGGLMYYGTDNRKMGLRAASYVAKILNGAKPADLPVEQPTEFELVVNLKTAKAIDVEMPPAILLRADEVIE